jgi:ribosomal protein L11 methyltransferase
VYTDAARAAAIEAAFPDAISSVVEPGWEERWREHHRAVEAGGLWVGPPWEAPPPAARTVVIDPGRAFGTGAHATTRACVELLARERRGSVLDAGCGSGVLAIAAVRLGFEPVLAVDVDPVAVETARANAERNGVDIEVSQLDALHDPLPPSALVVANIELAAVEGLLARRPTRRAITSGYLAEQLPQVPGWTVAGAVEVEGWSAHVLEAR